MSTTPSQLTGLFKEVYGDEIKNLVPEAAKVVKMIPFVPRDKELGNKYHQPVIVYQEQGVTYAAADAGAFSLNDTVSMAMQDAQVQGAQMLLRSALSYDAAARASNSKKAFAKSTELLVENMMESLTKRLEICLLHGQVGLGVKSASANVNSTTTTITISTASFAAGIWAGLEQARIQFYLVSDGSLVSSGADSIFTIDRVDIANRQLRVTGTATGITALDAAGNADIYFRGSRASASAWNEMAGLRRIFTNSGTLFNIDAAVYNLWRGNSYSASSGQLTMAKVLAAVSQAVQRGLNEKVVLLVNPITWNNLNSDMAALRRFDGSYKSSESDSGVQSIKYYAQNGEIEIVSHAIVKEGEAFMFPPKRCKRIGAQEISFKTPGRDDEIFLHLPSNAGFELRVYTDQALFVEMPSRCVYISGIVNA